MTDFQTCKACKETKPVSAFERLASGSHRGSCMVCRAAAATTRVTAAAQKRDAHATVVSDARYRLRQEIKDDLWTALHTGRSRRAPLVIREKSEGSHRIRLRDGTGYISVAELSCRCLEREALFRATKACKSHADTPRFTRVLEQGNAGLERTRTMHALGRQAESTLTCITEVEPIELDPFADAFADWSPGYTTDPASSLAYA
ncbi:hypothetical protein FHS92_000950 [Sphingobium subterraneum]|uniref:Uncharacterized protein n=1 Tax=Sphingobium subterraneum TaxID=627688 RepID=A0A841IX55_9SPHN|nr:hypothetical protein [Sphingobium subterraneum]